MAIPRPPPGLRITDLTDGREYVDLVFARCDMDETTQRCRRYARGTVLIVHVN